MNDLALKQRLSGSWTLDVWLVHPEAGEAVTPFSDCPAGCLHYAEDGSMYAFLHHPCWADGTAGPPPFPLFSAYSGDWSVQNGKVCHLVRFSSVAETIGRHLERRVELHDDGRLILSTDWEAWSGPGCIRHELRWHRTDQATTA
jgi:hypothetical protein